MPHGQTTETENRSNTITYSTKPYKIKKQQQQQLKVILLKHPGNRKPGQNVSETAHLMCLLINSKVVPFTKRYVRKNIICKKLTLGEA